MHVDVKEETFARFLELFGAYKKGDKRSLEAAVRVHPKLNYQHALTQQVRMVGSPSSRCSAFKIEVEPLREAILKA